MFFFLSRVKKYPEGAWPVCKYGPCSISERHQPIDASRPVPSSRFTHYTKQKVRINKKEKERHNTLALKR